MISKAISELLASHECVIVPGLGGFLISHLPARIDMANSRFYPPFARVAFNAGLSGNDGLLANYVASKKNITYKQALEEINVWVSGLLSELKKGEIIHLEKTGTLSLNKHKHIQFEPDPYVNYNVDSFGLTVIDSPYFRFSKKLSGTAQGRTTYSAGIRYMVVETLKWVAVLAPLAAFTLWGFENKNVISSALRSDAGLFSWSSATPGKTIDVSFHHVVVPENRQMDIYEGKHAGIIGFLPAREAFSVLKSSSETTLRTSKETNPVPSGEYHIITGAFRDPDNALKMVQYLTTMGYPAAIVDTNARGLFIVSIRNFNTRNEALDNLKALQEKGFEGAWLLRKKS